MWWFQKRKKKNIACTLFIFVVFFPVMTSFPFLIFTHYRSVPFHANFFNMYYLKSYMYAWLLLHQSNFVFTYVFTQCKLLEHMPHSQEDELYHIRYQMLFFSMKPLTHIHVKWCLSCVCFKKKFPNPVSLGFQKAKP